MQSLSDLNNYSNDNKIDVTDDRDTQLIYTGPAGDAEFTTFEGERIYFGNALGVEIEDIVDYANLNMEVEIELLSPFASGTTAGYTDKPSYITVTQVDAVTVSITGFRSIADWQWLKNKFYIENDVDWFGTFSYAVTISNDVSAPDTTFEATITVLELQYFSAPAAYNYPYTSSGYTAYPNWTINGSDATTDGNYVVEIQAIGDFADKLVDATSSSSLIDSENFDTSTRKFTMTASNKANAQDGINNITFDFGSKQYPMTFNISVKDESVSEIGRDFEVQTVYSDDDTILTEGTAITHTNTAFTLGTNTPKFNTGLSGSGDLVADITVFDTSTITDIDGPDIPISNFGTETLETISNPWSSATGYIRDISLDGSRLVIFYVDGSGGTPVYYRKLLDFDSAGSPMYTVAIDIQSDLGSDVMIKEPQISQDGNTLWYLKSNVALPSVSATMTLVTHKYSGGSWTKYTSNLSSDFTNSSGYVSAPLYVKYHSDDGTIIGFVKNAISRPEQWYQWNGSTNTWDDYDITGTKFAFKPYGDPDEVFGASNGFYANDGNVFVRDLQFNADSTVDNQLIIYRYENNAWNEFTIDEQGDGSTVGYPINGAYAHMSANGEFLSAKWHRDDDDTDDMWVWQYDGNGVYNVYLVDSFINNTEASGTDTNVSTNMEGRIDNNGDVLVFVRDETISDTTRAFIYPFVEGVGYNPDDKIELTLFSGYTRGNIVSEGQQIIVPSWTGRTIHSVERETSATSGPTYSIKINAQILASEINLLEKRIIITADSITNMNTYLEDVEVTPAGTDDIVMIFKVTAPDGTTTEKIYTVEYGGP